MTKKEYFIGTISPKTLPLRPGWYEVLINHQDGVERVVVPNEDLFAGLIQFEVLEKGLDYCWVKLREPSSGGLTRLLIHKGFMAFE